MKIIRFVFFLFLTIKATGQKLDFVITCQNQPVRQTANILFKENDKIKEYTSIKTGSGSYILKNKYHNLLIEINVFGYKPVQYFLKKIYQDKTYHIKIGLQKIDQLKEVVIFSRKKISVTKDTVTYDVKSYIKPTDVKVVDVLQRLPGIELDEETGKVKFNGKPIQTVLLDGENLFDSNYTLGTKNINIKAVDKIQAIEHYRENPLLKKLINGENTVLNLKLKKNLTDISGDINMSAGLNTDKNKKTDAGASILGINRKIKSFGVLNYNNMGIDYMPVDIFERKQEVDYNKKNYYTFAPVSFTIDKLPNIKNTYQNFNNQLFTTGSLLYKISKATKIRTNFFYLTDRNTFDERIENTITSGSNPVYFSSQTSQNLKPKLYRANLKLISKPSQRNYFTDVFNIDFNPNRFNEQIVKNNAAELISFLNTKDNYISNVFDFTHLFNHKFAVRLLQQLDYNSVFQNYNVSNGIEQIIDNHVNTAFVKLEGIGLSRFFQKYRLGFSALYQSFCQKHETSDSTLANFEKYQNQLEYVKLTQSASVDYKINAINIKPRIDVSYYNIKKQSRFFEPFKFNLKLAVQYNFNLQNYFSVSGGVTQKPLRIDRFHNYFLYADYRTKLRYQTFFDFQRSKFADVGYFYNKSYPIIHVHTGITFSQNQGYLSPDFSRTKEQTEITYRFYQGNQSQIFSYFFIDGYFSKIKSTLIFKTDYSYFNNQITSNLKQDKVQMNRYDISFGYSSAFGQVFNLSNTMKFTSNNNNFSSFYYWYNQLKLFLNLKKYSLTISDRLVRYMHNDLYHFSDIEIFRKINKSMSIRLAAQNIFNIRTYDTVDINDDLLMFTRISLQPRLYSFELNMNF